MLPTRGIVRRDVYKFCCVCACLICVSTERVLFSPGVCSTSGRVVVQFVPGVHVRTAGRGAVQCAVVSCCVLLFVLGLSV